VQLDELAFELLQALAFVGRQARALPRGPLGLAAPAAKRLDRAAESPAGGALSAGALVVRREWEGWHQNQTVGAMPQHKMMKLLLGLGDAGCGAGAGIAVRLARWARRTRGSASR
jgi:hypothetical protein